MGDFDTAFWIIVGSVGSVLIIFLTIKGIQAHRKHNHPITRRRKTIRDWYRDFFTTSTGIVLDTDRINTLREKYYTHAKKNSAKTYSPDKLRYGVSTVGARMLAGTFHSSSLGEIAGTSLGIYALGLGKADYLHHRLKCSLVIFAFPVSYATDGVAVVTNASRGLLESIFDSGDEYSESGTIRKELFGIDQPQPIEQWMNTVRSNIGILVWFDGTHCYVQLTSNKPYSLKKEFEFIEICMGYVQDLVSNVLLTTPGKTNPTD